MQSGQSSAVSGECAGAMWLLKKVAGKPKGEGAAAASAAATPELSGDGGATEYRRLQQAEAARREAGRARQKGE